jgi:glycosyltransferase involved in cell wall biosynthesis
LRSTSSERSIFLFVGSLYKEKGVDILLKNYLKLYNEYNSKAPELVIIGDGEELRNLVVYCEMNGLEDKVRFLGRVTNEEQLAKYFNKSLCLITPNQAGLTVLKALFYGVPVLTSKHAITGGELYNIIDDYNGQLFTSEEEIYPYLKKYMNNPKYVSHLSSNALLSYESSASYDMQLTSFKTVLNELV